MDWLLLHFHESKVVENITVHQFPIFNILFVKNFFSFGLNYCICFPDLFTHRYFLSSCPVNMTLIPRNFCGENPLIEPTNHGIS